MSQQRRQLLLLSLLVGCLLLVTLWSYGQLVSRRATARAAVVDFQTCQTLIRQIQHLQQGPALAGAQELQQAELAQRIEDAARRGQVPANAIARIWPEPARRLGQTPYKEKATQVLLQQVTLRQTVAFLHALTADQASGLSVKSLRLVAPRGQETGDRWTVETTLTYLIFSPSTAPGPGSFKPLPPSFSATGTD